MVGRSILIVDDEAPIREMIAVALEMAGYDCLEAENAQQAHSIIVDRKPDLILLDWMLPGGTSGIELARRLKREEMTGDIPIIMLTAKGEEDNKIQGLEVGADDYITKPFPRASWWRASKPCYGVQARRTANPPLKLAACCSTRSATASPSTAPPPKWARPNIVCCSSS